MFINVLTIFYLILVTFLIVMYVTKQRNRVIDWAYKNGLKNNFFIRMIRKRPRKKNQSDISKAFMT